MRALIDGLTGAEFFNLQAEFNPKKLT